MKLELNFTAPDAGRPLYWTIQRLAPDLHLVIGDQVWGETYLSMRSQIIFKMTGALR